MDTKPRLILFDMDNTLIDVGVHHREALRRTLRNIFNLNASHDGRKHPGNTQRQIMLMICRENGVDESEISLKIDESMHYLSKTAVELFPSDLKDAVLPGVERLLQALHENGQYMGLVTGTLASTGSVLLARTGLEKYFPLKVFGDEADQRIELVDLAIQKASKLYGEEWKENGLVTVGDAIPDLLAGRAHGAKVVSVATGYKSKEELEKYHPDVLLEDLVELDIVLEALLE
ncbi:MAG: HAD family hydrolase [Anaerolineales bacterium]|jgi:phosphoglycolate phosphatase-like HAD superfamily hydrolase